MSFLLFILKVSLKTNVEILASKKKKPAKNIIQLISVKQVFA